MDSHSSKFDLIDQRFEAIDQRFDTIDERFRLVDQRFDSLDIQVDLIVQKMTEHDNRLDQIEENMVTKQEHREATERIISAIDEVLKINKRTEDETCMFKHGQRRHEDRLEVVEKDVAVMKPILGLG